MRLLQFHTPYIYVLVLCLKVGPFIIYEYCSNGQLRDYLESMRDQVTVETQERLLRFGLGVARGMDYLSQRKVRLKTNCYISTIDSSGYISIIDTSNYISIIWYILSAFSGSGSKAGDYGVYLCQKGEY